MSLLDRVMADARIVEAVGGEHQSHAAALHAKTGGELAHKPHYSIVRHPTVSRSDREAHLRRAGFVSHTPPTVVRGELEHATMKHPTSGVVASLQDKKTVFFKK